MRSTPPLLIWVFALGAVAGLILVTMAAIYWARAQSMSSSIATISTVDEWRASLTSGQRIVFVDGEWNSEIVAFRKPFGSFGGWCLSETNYQPRVLALVPDDNDPLFQELQRFFKAQKTETCGLKTYGGGGRVLWLENGRLVDVAWWNEVGSEATLKSRTQVAFRQE
jgi:hypothetical protein